MSEAWKHFTKRNNAAECKICNKRIVYKGGSTSGLLQHLLRVHKIKLGGQSNEANQNDVDKSAQEVHRKKATTVESFMLPKTMSQIISKLAALDGMSIRMITRSTFIRESFASRNMALPKYETDVKNHILSYFKSVKEAMINEIKAEVSGGGRFSLILDEWTNVAQRRYLNICLHGNNSFFNLGLVFISERCNATGIRSIIDERLQEFGLALERHIVATTSDGPNVMKRLVLESPIEGFFCWNHGIHLAVMDVVYKKTEINYARSSSEESDDEQSCIVDECYDENENFREALDQTRKIVKIFKRSPLKNSYLQKYVKEELGKEVHLAIDVKTRWNSMVDMIQSFLKIKTSIKKTLIDLDCSNLWEEKHVAVLETLLAVLSPIKDAVEALSRRDMNLLVADVVVNTLHKQLLLNSHVISQHMAEAIRIRITERRNEKMLSLIKYLKSPDSLDLDLPKKTLKLYAQQLHSRLFHQSGSEITSSSNTDGVIETQIDSSFENKLKTAIESAKAPPKTFNGYQNNFLQKELALFEFSKSRTKNLEDLYNSLLTIKPTSVECERVFSIAGNFTTKIRNRTSNELLNALVILKTHFLKEK